MTEETYITVTLETFSWISTTFGKPESGRQLFQRKLKDGAVLNDLFQDLAGAYPEFGRQIYNSDRGWMGNDLMVIVNHSLVQFTEFDRLRLKDNDEISLSPVLVGG
jgi:hypothetical protein